MPAKTSLHIEKLAQLPDWVDDLKENSGLPGPRGNLELADAVFQLGDQARFESLLALDGPDVAENTPENYLVFCGLVGLGKLLAQGDRARLETLRHYANDLRWRIREGCAIALQKYGAVDMPGLLSAIRSWADGTRLEQRAVTAALCEPALLRDPANTRVVLELLDRITSSCVAAGDAKTDEFRSLRQTLGYSWSVAAAAGFGDARPLLERWFSSPDPDVRWIMRENLKKNRLVKKDPEWVEGWARKLAGK